MNQLVEFDGMQNETDLHNYSNQNHFPIASTMYNTLDRAAINWAFLKITKKSSIQIYYRNARNGSFQIFYRPGSRITIKTRKRTKNKKCFPTINHRLNIHITSLANLHYVNRTWKTKKRITTD